MLTSQNELIGELQARQFGWAGRSTLAIWSRQHNYVLDHWAQDSPIRLEEKVILDWALAITQWGDVHHPDTDYVAHGIAAGMLQAFRGALNFNCGRLDCGTLDSWALRTAEQWGIGEEEL